jgi:hypothetical protein
MSAVYHVHSKFLEWSRRYPVLPVILGTVPAGSILPDSRVKWPGANIFIYFNDKNPCRLGRGQRDLKWACPYKLGFILRAQHHFIPLIDVQGKL